MFEYFWDDDIIEKYFTLDSITPSKSFKNITNDQKNYYMRHFEVSSDLVTCNGIFYARATRQWTVLQLIWNRQTRFYESVSDHIFVPKFYHDRPSRGFLKHLKYLGKTRSQIDKYERMYYIYKSESTTLHTIQDSEIDWNYLDKYSITIGSTVRGFTFTFPDLKKNR